MPVTPDQGDTRKLTRADAEAMTVDEVMELRRYAAILVALAKGLAEVVGMNPEQSLCGEVDGEGVSRQQPISQVFDTVEKLLGMATSDPVFVAGGNGGHVH